MLESANAGDLKIFFGMKVPAYVLCFVNQFLSKNVVYPHQHCCIIESPLPFGFECICIYLILVSLEIAFALFCSCFDEGGMHKFDAGRVGGSDW